MRILLIEDEKRMAQALCEILRLENYEVDHCAGGECEAADGGGGPEPAGLRRDAAV